MKLRFMAALMGVTLLVLLIQDVPLGYYLEKVEHDRIITSLERDAFLIAQHSEEAIESADPSDDGILAEQAQTYSGSDGARVVIVNAEGTALAVSDEDQTDLGTSFASRPEIQQALTGEISTGHRFSTTLNQELLYVAVPVFSGNKVLGAVRITYPDYVINNIVNSQLWLLSLVALGSVLAAGVVGYLVSGTITRRINRLQEATERLASGDLQARADSSHGPTELTSLASSFNDMAVKLDALIKQQQTFAADASHQLRTPLTALRLRLERAQELIDVDPAAAADRLAAAEAEAVRLNNIIEGLLLLSRTEASVVTKEVFDLSDIAQSRIEQWQSLADENNVAITFTGPKDVKVVAIPEAIEQVLDNLIDNALSASAAGSGIEIMLEVSGATATIEVLDRGKGLTIEECTRAFDRFWRATSDQNGSGLGLAIVAELMKASGGSAQLKPRAGGGLIASAVFLTA